MTTYRDFTGSDRQGSLKSLFDLQANECRYPYGDDNFLFCGAAAEQAPYCEFHRRLCYNPMPGSRRQPPPE